MIGAALAEAAQRLAAVSDTPRLDAELLMAHALHATRNDLLLHHLDAPVPAGFEPLIQRRLTHEPIAYIIGTRAFWTLDLQVGPGALIPRPDSETLIEAAIAHFGARVPARILDLGTGPGTLLLAALDHWPDATGLGIDASERALDYARANARRLGLDGRGAFQAGDWTEGLAGAFDLILANPPYIGTREPLPAQVREHEPPSALFAGIDGLDDYRRIVPELPRFLAPGGCAVLEIGHTQAEAVSSLGMQQGLASRVYKDLGGRPRVVLLT